MAKLAVKICASLACADWLHLEQELRALEKAGVDYLHIDVMDGTFVPNFALSLDLMRLVHKATSLPLDVHLMIVQPERYLEAFAQAGAEIITVHQEASLHLQRTLSHIHSLGVKAGVALNPATPLHMLDYVLEDLDLLLIMTVNPGFAGQQLIPNMLKKIADARQLLTSHGLDTDIQVDGNVSFANAPAMVRAGATSLVGGTSSIFSKETNILEGVQRLRRLAEKALPAKGEKE
ncbi:MAG: ribulose-phosphate 3-epimerase [Anaerolineae bacterium]|nr:ribulose-phosphate 3-epimerase [Anaerolineae bacterium]